MWKGTTVPAQSLVMLLINVVTVSWIRYLPAHFESSLVSDGLCVGRVPLSPNTTVVRDRGPTDQLLGRHLSTSGKVVRGDCIGMHATQKPLLRAQRQHEAGLGNAQKRCRTCHIFPASQLVRD